MIDGSAEPGAMTTQLAPIHIECYTRPEGLPAAATPHHWSWEHPRPTPPDSAWDHRSDLGRDSGVGALGQAT